MNAEPRLKLSASSPPLPPLPPSSTLAPPDDAAPAPHWHTRVTATRVRWIVMLMLLATSACFLSWIVYTKEQQRAAQQASVLFAQGWQLMTDGELTEAETLFHEFLRRSTDYPQRAIERAQVLCYLGRLADKQGQRQAAEGFYQEGSALLEAQFYPPRYSRQPDAELLRRRCASMI